MTEYMTLKEKPILFKGDMVRAILESRKTETRRIVKPQPSMQLKNNTALNEKSNLYWLTMFPTDAEDDNFFWKCPYGQVGDRLWVRETWADVNSSSGPAIAYRADSSYIDWHSFSKTFGPDYGAGPSMDYESYPGNYSMWFDDLINRDVHKEEGYNWRPSIYMPRWASRITLEITEISVERVQDITEESAWREGLAKRRKDPIELKMNTEPGRYWFRKLWDSINEKRGFGWDSNPWVWVVKFKVVK